MGRHYAGILGTLAMAVVLCRGALQDGGAESTLATACVSLFLFAIIGPTIGYVAQTTIDESVRAKLEQQLARRTTTGGAGGAAA
jgi:hypothetical protein